MNEKFLYTSEKYDIYLQFDNDFATVKRKDGTEHAVSGDKIGVWEWFGPSCRKKTWKELTINDRKSVLVELYTGERQFRDIAFLDRKYTVISFVLLA